MTQDVGSVEDARVGWLPADERLVNAVTVLVGEDGYAELEMGRLLAAAGVSRTSFYQHFENVEDCFWSAYRRHAGRFLADLGAAGRGSGPRELVVLDALVLAAISEPGVARLLICEGLAAGPHGLAERDGLISGVEQAIGGAAAQARIDLPLAVLIGGVFRFLSMSLVESGRIGDLRGEVQQWVGLFVVSGSQRLWSSRFAPTLGRHEVAPTEQAILSSSAGSLRERILRATAASVREQGYRAVTVADIAQAAGVSRQGFYNEFPSKAEAFVAAYEETVQRTLAVCAPAFFKPGPWPQRVWNGVQAATELLGSEPSSAYLGFVESYAIGPAFAARAHDTQLAFTLFLEDGYRQRPEARSLSRACSVLTSTAIFETGFQASRHGAGLGIQRMQPLAVYIALAPFIGVDAAGEFVAGRLSAHAHPRKQDFT